jgi:hypothetical protein
MMLDLPHTLAPMLMQGNIPPTMRFLPHRSRLADTHPTDNPPQSARKNGAGEARRRGGRRRGRPPFAACAGRHRPAACAASPHQHQPHPPRQDAAHSARLYKRLSILLFIPKTKQHLVGPVIEKILKKRIDNVKGYMWTITYSCYTNCKMMQIFRVQ